MYGKNQWRGREVEGRYSDMMTWFIRSLNKDRGVRCIYNRLSSLLFYH
jgi:hypothetical protein